MGRRLRFQVHDPTPDCGSRGLRAVIRVQFIKDAFHVVFHSVLGNHELVCYLLIAGALHDEI
jgi:hypothetical protein